MMEHNGHQPPSERPEISTEILPGLRRGGTGAFFFGITARISPRPQVASPEVMKYTLAIHVSAALASEGHDVVFVTHRPHGLVQDAIARLSAISPSKHLDNFKALCVGDGLDAFDRADAVILRYADVIARKGGHRVIVLDCTGMNEIAQTLLSKSWSSILNHDGEGLFAARERDCTVLVCSDTSWDAEWRVDIRGTPNKLTASFGRDYWLITGAPAFLFAGDPIQANETDRVRAVVFLSQLLPASSARMSLDPHATLGKKILVADGDRWVSPEMETPTENSSLLERLEDLSRITVSKDIYEGLRPSSFFDIVGQDEAVEALRVKIETPYPQHVIIYGPPGVGKTSAARLALQAARHLDYTPFAPNAPFVEADGTTLWVDPYAGINPLLGSVHDPIYKGGGRLSEEGLPEPKPGLVTQAHGGVLFIDEIGELHPLLQHGLLKVLEDRKVRFESSYYNRKDAAKWPRHVRYAFEHGAPADFILIGATTRSPEEIPEAFRSRCAEVFFSPLSQWDIQRIVYGAAHRMSFKIEDGIAEFIAQRTSEGRKAVQMLVDAVAYARSNGLYSLGNKSDDLIKVEHVAKACAMSRSVALPTFDHLSGKEVGRIAGLAVSSFRGRIMEIEAVAKPGKGDVLFNGTAGSMAHDSIRNVISALRGNTRYRIDRIDLHVNLVGGGQADGPSAGLPILLAIYSSLLNIPLPQDFAATGEVSIRGRVCAVGGLAEKVHAAQQAGLKYVMVPTGNTMDITVGGSVEIVPVSNVSEAIRWVRRRCGVPFWR